METTSAATPTPEEVIIHAAEQVARCVRTQSTNQHFRKQNAAKIRNAQFFARLAWRTAESLVVNS